MEKRINISKIEPDAYKAMLGMESYIETVSLDPRLKDLIKIRASQINGCAYCIQMHTREARKSGETEDRLYALSAWHESPLFTELERVVLAVTEEVTLISEKGLSTDTYSNALGLLGENGLAQCIMQITIINSWNRIAVATKMKHE